MSRSRPGRSPQQSKKRGGTCEWVAGQLARTEVNASAHAGEMGSNGSGDLARSLLSYVSAFGPTPHWEEIPWWPPDVFTVANLGLDHTQGYRLVVAPPSGRRWPPLPDWSAQVSAAAKAWTAGTSSRGCEPPPFVRRCWRIVTRYRETPLERIRTGESWALAAALLTLHAIADEACAEVASGGRRVSSRSFEGRAWTLLQTEGSLSHLSPARVRVVPKAHLSARGITIRSLSRYLALSYESVEVRWRSVEPGALAERTDYNMVLVPWPLSINAHDFRPARPSVLENMDLEHFGFFEFVPTASLDREFVGSLLEAAVAKAGRVDAVVFPEAAISPDAIPDLERTLARHGATFLIAGVSQPATGTTFGRNYLHFGVHAKTGWSRYEQDKHHRWCLDEAQIRQYQLSRSLQPTRMWWEAIDVCERTLHLIDVGSGVTTAPLVCEDLARLDEVADLIRRIGPSLVIAVLLDGPQLGSRWPSRYASVIADDPGSAVLTLTSYGMARRSRALGARRSRAVAHWNSRSDGLHEIEFPARADGILLTTTVESSTSWTADGRCHRNVPQLRLSAIHPLRARSPGIDPFLQPLDPVIAGIRT